MVWHAPLADLQSLLSFPFPPLTYQVLLAKAAGATHRNTAMSSSLL